MTNGIAKGLIFTRLQESDLIKGPPIDMLAPGTLIDMYSRRFEFDADDFEEYVANTQAAIEATADSNGDLVGLPIDPGGHEEGDGSAGWIVGVDLETAKNGLLVIIGEVKWTDIGVDLVGRKVKRFFSATVDTARKVIKGGSLTNWPATRDIETGITLLRPVELARLAERPGTYLLQDTDDEDSLDEQVHKVRTAWWDAIETMEGPDSYVMEVFDDHVIVEMGEDYFQVPYQEAEDGGILFSDREEWTEVRRTWVEVAMSVGRAVYHSILDQFGLSDGATDQGGALHGQMPINEGTGSASWSISTSTDTNEDDGSSEDHEEDVMTVKLLDFDEKERQELIDQAGAQMAKQMGLTPEDVQAALNGNADMGEGLATLVDRRAKDLMDAELAKEKRATEIAEFTEEVTGGDEENPGGLPVKGDRLKAFLSKLDDDDLRGEAMDIFRNIQEHGVTEFGERGHNRRMGEVTELPDWAAEQLDTFLTEDDEATVAEWFKLNEAEVGAMEDYDLSDFEAKEK